MAAVMEALGEPDDFYSRQEREQMQHAIDLAEDITRSVQQEIEQDKVTRLVHRVGRYSVASEVYDFAKDPAAPSVFGLEPHPHFHFPHLN